MRTALIILTALVLSALTGCNGPAKKKEPPGKRKELLSVDFQQGQTLRYRFVSRRSIDIVTKSTSRGRKDSVDKTYESLEMVVAYTPIEIDPDYGLTTIKATCELARIKRSGRRVEPQDAVETLSGKSFTFTVSPVGKIEDYSQLENLIKEVGKKAFRAKSKMGRIKEPDMISDFIATQWFLWDSISSIEKPVEGVSVGQSWKSKLSVPSPMVMQQARDVTYRLDGIRRTEKGRLAVIKSSFTPAESAPKNWPIPYPDGVFQMSGKFGFYRNYRVLDLQGQGEELHNIETGRTENYNQQYQMTLKASAPFGITLDIQMTIKQKLTMRLLEDSPSQ